MQNKSNESLLKSLLFLIVGMFFLTFASVPIYNVFCKVTGIGGTVKKSLTGSTRAGKKNIMVRFDANVEPSLKWEFFPKQKQVSVTTGENSLVFYYAKNLTKKNIVGTAIYNVAPLKAGKYFNKIHCFCFEEQMLEADKAILMPVSFFINNEFDDDPDMNDVDTITLSYSFFKIREIE